MMCETLWTPDVVGDILLALVMVGGFLYCLGKMLE